MGDSIKVAEARLTEIAVLKTHIINYAKTREVYTAYRKTGYSKAFLEAHREENTLHKAAKAAFDEAGLQKAAEGQGVGCGVRRGKGHHRENSDPISDTAEDSSRFGEMSSVFFLCIAKIYDWIFVKHELSLYSC